MTTNNEQPEGRHEFLEHPRGRFRNPKNAIGKCWEVVNMIYCGQPQSAPIHPAQPEGPQPPPAEGREPWPSPLSGEAWSTPDVLPLLEYAMRLTMNVDCDCDRTCSRECLGSTIWDVIHRARKLVRADLAAEGESDNRLSAAWEALKAQESVDPAKATRIVMLNEPSVREFVRVGEGFTATLWNEEFNGVPVEFIVNGKNATDATAIQEENNSYRVRLREYEARIEHLKTALQDEAQKALNAQLASPPPNSKWIEKAVRKISQIATHAIGPEAEDEWFAKAAAIIREYGPHAATQVCPTCQSTIVCKHGDHYAAPQAEGVQIRVTNPEGRGEREKRLEDAAIRALMPALPEREKALRECAGIADTVKRNTQVADNRHRDYNEGYRDATKFIEHAIRALLAERIAVLTNSEGKAP